MISNYQKVPPTPPPQQQKTKQRQLNTCLLNSIKGNLSLTLATKPSEQSSLESNKASTMSTLTQDLRTAAVAATAGNNMPSVKPPLDAVVVNSIIYSKPSFCTIAVDLGDFPGAKKPTTNGSYHKNIFNSESFCSPAMSFKTAALNCNAASCLAGLTATSSSSSSSSSLLQLGDDAKVYRMCTTINGAIHHQISELCDNILAMAEFFKDTNNKQDDDSFIEFNYGDDDFICNDDDEDEEDDDEDDDDFLDDEEVDYDDDLDDDNDVVDFSYECPIEPAPKLNCDKKKKVRFNTKLTVHVMHTWSYAYRAARKGEWEMYARDRERFKLRIQRAALILNPILEREHRQKIYEKRFVNLYDIDDPVAGENNVSAEVKETKEETSTTNIESKKPHQKKKRRKRRFCKMGNKHYF